MQDAPSNSPNRSPNVRIAFIVLIAALLRVIFLGARSFWSDEIVSVKLATDNWGGFWFWVSSREANMALYYLLLRGWVKVGDSEAWVRLFSAVAGIVTIPLLYALTRRLCQERVAWITTLLAASSACLVEFSQEARSYSLVILLCVLSWYFFVRILQDESRWPVFAHALVSIAALYAHFFAALVILAQAVSVLWLPPKSVRWGRLVASWVTIAFGAAPISFYIFKRDVGQLYWVQSTTISEIYKLTIFFAGGSKAVAAVLSVLSLAAIGAAIAANKEMVRSRNEASWRFMVGLLWGLLPVVITVLVSLIRPVFVHRYLLVALPGYLILLALGLARLRRQAMLAVALTVFIGLSAVSIAQGYFRPVEDWRGAVDYVLSRTTPEDTVLVYIPYGMNDFIFYTARRERAGLPMTLGNLDSAHSVQQLESIASPRAWLLLYPSPHVGEDAPGFEQALQSRYTSVERKQFKGIELLLYKGLKQPPSHRP